MAGLLRTEHLKALEVQIPKLQRNLKIVKTTPATTSKSCFIARCTICGLVLETTGFFVHLLRHINRSEAAEKKRQQRQKLRDTETESEAVDRKEMVALKARERRKIRNFDDGKPVAKLKAEHVCSVCGKVLQDAAYLKIHEKTHTKDFDCEECGKKFTQMSVLLVHMRDTHSELLNYKCDVCGKEFKHKGSLRIHSKEHDDPQSKRCDICNKDFPSRFGALQHQRRRHQNHKTAES